MTFSRDKRWICAFISSHLDDSKRLCLAVWNLAKVITLSRSFCTLFFFSPFSSNLSPVSPIFSTRGSRQVTLLYFIACCLFWQGVWHKRCGRLSPTHTAPSLHSVQCQPIAPTPACLVQLQSRGTWQTELLWSRSNRKSMRKDFPYSGGVRQGIKVCFKPF